MKPTPEEEAFVKGMNERHQQNLADFGMPDEFMDLEEAKIFKFSSEFQLSEAAREMVFFNPLPVFSAQTNKLIGACNVYPNGLDGWFKVEGSVDYNSYERLDAQNGEPVIAIPMVREGRLVVRLGKMDWSETEYWGKATAVKETEE